MRQRADHFAQHPAVSLDIRGPHLQKIVEARRHHVALLHLGHRQDRAVEGGQRSLSRVAEPHLDKGHMRLPHPDRVKDRPVAGDHPGLFQPLHPGLRRRFRKPDAPRQLHRRNPPFGGQDPQDRAVETIQIGPGI